MLDTLAMVDDIKPTSYIAREERRGRPLPTRESSIGKHWRMIDLWARARASGHEVRPIPKPMAWRDHPLSHFEEMEAHRIVGLQRRSLSLTDKRLLREKEIVDAAGTASEFAPICGVYFLVELDRVVYVGQSTNIAMRLTGHSGKKYSKVVYIECARERLDALESLYIYLLQPPLNGGGNRGVAAPMSLSALLDADLPAMTG